METGVERCEDKQERKRKGKKTTGKKAKPHCWEKPISA
jgi:hypothetical protein